MFTAKDAKQIISDDLDERIANAIRNHRGRSGAYLRIYHEDSFSSSIIEELEKRGFKNIVVPDYVTTADVYFEWD